MLFRKIENKSGAMWECSLELPKDPVTGKRRRITARAKRKPEAKALAEKKYRDVTEFGLTTDPGQSTITFKELAAQWLETHKKNKKESAHRSDGYHVRRFGKYLSSVSVRDITPKMYQNVIDQMEAEGYAFNTIYSAHTVAKKIFRQGLMWQIIKSSPADMAIMPKEKVTIEQLESDEEWDQKYLEHDELAGFLKVARDHGLWFDDIVFTLLAFTGMRIGELLALKWTDIDFEGQEISITKTLFNVDGKKNEYQLLTPKTKKSIRKISLDEELVQLLKKAKAMQNEKKVRNRVFWHEENFVIAREDGYPMSPRFIYYRLKRLSTFVKEETSITKHLHPHIFRHTHTSMLTEAGVPLPAIMQRLGHVDGRTTLSIYTHVTEALKKSAAEQLANSKYGNMINR